MIGGVDPVDGKADAAMLVDFRAGGEGERERESPVELIELAIGYSQESACYCYFSYYAANSRLLLYFGSGRRRRSVGRCPVEGLFLLPARKVVRIA